MKRFFFYFTAVFFMLLLSGTALQAQKGKKITAEKMLFNSSQGREFWIAIPANEVPTFSTNDLEIYVTSAKNTTVKLELPTGKILNKKVTAFKITTFSTATNDIGWDLEVRDSERVTEQGIHLTADQPLSVYVLNAKPTSSEGYLALPVNALGTEYIHNSYPDFSESRDWATGFVIVATEDYTRIQIELKGKGKGFATTDKGSEIGDVIREQLMEGQTYYVRGDGKTRGRFDLSGTRITSNKPIGLISTHMRTIIPHHIINNGRDHLAEMMPPVTAWGKKYSTVEYVRNSGMGDYFRIIASEDNTTWNVKWYDRNTQEMIGQTGGQLDAYEFAEYLNIVAENNTPHEPSITGTSIWTADKPVLVMQYSYSANWDGNPVFDPFMILVVPVEQFVPKTVFQTPANSAFQDNYFNIIAIGDTSDPTKEDLKSVEMDGQAIYLKDPRFLYNQIPGTNLFWAKLNVAPGAHVVEGDTKFGGYIYGFSRFDSYGWPAAMAINKLDETDTVPPPITKEGYCGDYVLHSTEIVFGNEGDDPRQIDQGISEIEFLEVDNYEFFFPEELKPWPALREFDYELHVIDKTEDAYAKFYCMDRAGNATIDSVFYYADKLALDPDSLGFGDVRVNTTKELNALLKNVGEDSVEIKEIYLQFGEVFEIVEGKVPPEVMIASGEDHKLTIAYTPKKEGLTAKDRDRDSIIVKTECTRYSWPLDGRGVVPRILVQDWDAGAVVVNNQVCHTDQFSRGLEVRSIGTMPVFIEDVVNAADDTKDFKEFSLTDIKFNVNGEEKSLPLTLKPNERAYMTSLCFSPPDILNYRVVAKFVCDNEGIKDTSVWTGRGIVPGPKLTSYDWRERRVLTENDSVLVLTNEGNTPTWVTGFSKSDPGDTHFEITGTVPPLNNPVQLYPKEAPNGTKEILVNVRFTPQDEGQKEVEVIAEFDDDNIEPGSVRGSLRGFGVLPKIEVIGYEFENPILVGSNYDDANNYPNEETYVTIVSTSETADLHIYEILPVAKGPNPADFTWKEATPVDLTLPRGDTLKVPVRFTAGGINERRATVEVVSDAAPGPEVNPRVTTEADVIGYGVETGIENDSINYGEVILCDEPVQTFEIRNTSRTTKAVIENVELTNGDISFFEIVTTFPQEIGPEGTLDVQVRFMPDDLRAYNAYATITVEGSSDTYLARVQGVGYDVPVTLSLHKYKASDNITPGDIKPMRVYAECADWADAFITEITFDIVYERKWMKFNQSAGKGPLLKGSWLITADEIYDPSEPEIARLRVTLKNPDGNNPIDLTFNDKKELLTDPSFVMMLSDVVEFQPWIENISFGTRDDCVVPFSDPGNVVMNACVINLRVVDDIQGQYMMQSIDPNPSDGYTDTKVIYSVALEDHTTLKVFNNNGEEVMTLVDEVQKPGKYEAKIPVTHMNSGVYYIRMNSGPFKEVKSFVVTK